MASAPASTASTTDSKTIADLLPKAVERYGRQPAVMFKDASGEWVSRNYDEVGEIVRNLSLGLIDLGIGKGDKVSILANTRPEWTYFDFAALSAGATVVPIYQTNSPDECQYVLENSDARVVIVEDDTQLEKVEAVRARCPKLEHVIRMTGTGGAISLDELAERGRGRPESEWTERWRSVTPDDICTFIYTSGTTGPPKGCVISHGNYRAMVDMVLSQAVIEEDELTYLYLPLAHSFALLVQLGSFETGAQLAYWERDPLKIVPNLSEINPTYFPSVPRIFEKIYTTATTEAEKAGGLKKRIFDWSIDVGKRYRAAERSGSSDPGPLLRAQHAVADRLVLSKIRGIFGTRLRQALSGAAPVNPDILRFFDAAGVLVLEGWGMTETSTAATIATPDEFRIGTIGKPFPGCEVRVADDGEILVRGPNVFQGYYKNEEATRETIRDGWLHTGDLGEVDEDGFITITGRKKDIIITAGGKNITPANLEAEIKQHPLVSQCVVVGDRRPYLVALVTLDPEEVVKFAQENELPEDPEALASNEKVRAAIDAHVQQLNEKFARVEQVKKFTVLPQDLTQQAGELTPTLKVKRAAVADKYSGEVERLYAEG